MIPTGRRAPNGGHTALIEHLVSIADGLDDSCIYWPDGWARAVSGGRSVPGYARITSGPWAGCAHHYILHLNGMKRPDEMSVARHTCGRGQWGCVHPRHVTWGTHRENMKDRSALGEQRWDGERNSRAKLSASDVSYIRSAMKAGVSQSDLAKRYGVAQSSISHLKTGATWAKAAD